jgi:hypothetical protein
MSRSLDANLLFYGRRQGGEGREPILPIEQAHRSQHL